MISPDGRPAGGAGDCHGACAHPAPRGWRRLVTPQEEQIARRAEAREVEAELRAIVREAQLPPDADPNILARSPKWGLRVRRLVRRWLVLWRAEWIG